MRTFNAGVRRLAMVGAGTLLAGCAQGSGPGERGDTIVNPAIESVQAAHTKRWMKIPGVVGTAIGLCDANPCIKVLVVRATPELRKAIPDTVEGYRVVLDETGTVRAQDSSRR